MKDKGSIIRVRVYHSIRSEIIEMIESNTVNHYSHFVLNIPNIKMLIDMSYE